MYHTGPLSGVRLLAVGIPVVVLGRFDAEGVLQAIDTYHAETSVMVPTHFARLLALPEEVRARYDVSSVKLVGHTGAACPIDVKRQMIEWWGPVFFDAYGATEVGTTCMITSEEWLEHPGSVGRAIPPFTRDRGRRRRQRGAAAAPRAGSSSRTPPAGASSTRATPRRPPTPTSAPACSRWARSATSTTTATSSSPTASAT